MSVNFVLPMLSLSGTHAASELAPFSARSALVKNVQIKADKWSVGVVLARSSCYGEILLSMPVPLCAAKLLTQHTLHVFFAQIHAEEDEPDSSLCTDSLGCSCNLGTALASDLGLPLAA